MRQAIENEYGGDPTISVGLASYPGSATTKDILIEKAREALFQAKLKGKNKIHFFEAKSPKIASGSAKILVVDDNPQNMKLMKAMLLPLNYDVIAASNGRRNIHGSTHHGGSRYL